MLFKKKGNQSMPYSKMSADKQGDRKALLGFVYSQTKKAIKVTVSKYRSTSNDTTKFSQNLATVRDILDMRAAFFNMIRERTKSSSSEISVTPDHSLSRVKTDDNYQTLSWINLDMVIKSNEAM